MNKLSQEQMELAADQGITVMQVTGRTPCQIMMEHAEMLGYLKESARRDPGVESFVRKFIKESDTEKNWNKIIQPADFSTSTYYPALYPGLRVGVQIVHRPTGTACNSGSSNRPHINSKLAWAEMRKQLLAAGWSDPA